MLKKSQTATSDGSPKCSPEKDGKHEANENQNTSGVSGQEGPDVTRKYASDTTNADRLSCNEQPRGRLRDADRHASWREVYAACEIGVGMND